MHNGKFGFEGNKDVAVDAYVWCHGGGAREVCPLQCAKPNNITDQLGMLNLKRDDGERERKAFFIFCHTYIIYNIYSRNLLVVNVVEFYKTS